MGVFFFFFRKASDPVDNENLLQILHSLGVHGNVHARMVTYLADMKQIVNVNSETSDLQLIKRGVPQGSFFGPLPFFVYTNGIGSNANMIAKLLLYVDDTVIVESPPSETADLKYLQSL